MGSQELAEVAAATDAHVRESIAAAITAAGENPHRVAAGTKIARSTLERKLEGVSRFTIFDAALIASHLGLHPAEFYPRRPDVAA